MGVYANREGVAVSGSGAFSLNGQSKQVVCPEETTWTLEENNLNAWRKQVERLKETSWTLEEKSIPFN